MTKSEGEAPALALARGLLEPGATPLVAGSPAELLEVVWGLKDLCYAAWSSEPQRAARAAEVLQGLASAHGEQSQPSQSTSWQSDGEQKIEVTAVAAWTSGIAHLTRGEMTAAIASFDAAADAFRRIGQIGHAAQTQVPKIMALSMLGKYADATACADRARAVFTELGDARSAGKVSLNLSALHERLGAYARAVQESRSAAVLFAQVGDLELSIMADINTASGLTALGEFDEALRMYARARNRAETRGFPVLEALAEESVALVQLARGQYRSALSGLESARRRYASLDMPQHLATAEKQLGDAYLELRLLPEASMLFEQAIERFRDLDFPDEQAWAIVQLGRVQALCDQPGQAAASLEAAAEIFARQGIDVGKATVNLARAELALATGDGSTALDLAARAGDTFDNAELPEGRLRADVVSANAYLNTGDIGLATRLFAATLERAIELDLLTLQVRCLTGQGLAARASGDVATTKSALERAITLFEDQRRALPGDDLRTAFLGDHLRPYQALLGVALDEYERDPGESNAVGVLKQLDRVRARSLLERLGRAPARGDDGQDQELRDRLNWLYRQIQRKEEEGEPAPTLVQEMRRAESALLEHARRARLSAPNARQHPSTAAARRTIADTAADLNVAELQRLMGEADALVAYGVHGDELFACVATPAGVQLRRNLAAWSDTLHCLSAARFQMETLAVGDKPFQRHIETLTRRMIARMQQLHALLWKPIADTLDGMRRILVVPHGQLGWLPFAALHDGSACLAQRFETAIVPGAQLAIHGYRHQPRASSRLLALGESSRLPYAAREAELVGHLFDDALVLTGERATLSAMQRHGGEFDVVHLASHGQFRADNPMFSALHLADGQLTVELAETLELRPGLVVLSACETGRSELRAGDEMVGLVRAFLMAGTARVLATSWSVGDEHAAQFMARFYAARMGGRTPAAALNHAQLETMRIAPHPFYWAAFTLYGGF